MSYCQIIVTYVANFLVFFLKSFFKKLYLKRKLFRIIFPGFLLSLYLKYSIYLQNTLHKQTEFKNYLIGI